MSKMRGISAGVLVLVAYAGSATAGVNLPPADCATAHRVEVFTFTGGIQQFAVPENVASSLRIQLRGAQGGSGASGGQSAVGGSGGLGGGAAGTLPISTGGGTLYVVVGGQGATPTGLSLIHISQGIVR